MTNLKLVTDSGIEVYEDGNNPCLLRYPGFIGIDDALCGTSKSRCVFAKDEICGKKDPITISCLEDAS